MRARYTRGPGTSLVALAALMLLAPHGAALELTVEGPAAPVAPGVAVSWSLAAKLPCTQVVEAATALRLHWQAEVEDPGITIVVPDPTELDPLGCGNGTATLVGHANATTTADQTVPADTAHRIVWTATLEGNGEAASAGSTLLVAHTGGVDVNAPATIKKGAPQKQVAYPLELRNLANGPTAVHFEVQQTDKGSVVAPPKVVLARAGQPGDTLTVDVLYVTPFKNGPNDAKETITVQVHASSLDGTPLQAPHEVVLLAETEGLYIPGPGAAPLALLGLALIGMRRRKA